MLESIPEARRGLADLQGAEAIRETSAVNGQTTGEGQEAEARGGAQKEAASSSTAGSAEKRSRGGGAYSTKVRAWERGIENVYAQKLRNEVSIALSSCLTLSCCGICGKLCRELDSAVADMQKGATTLCGYKRRFKVERGLCSVRLLHIHHRAPGSSGSRLLWNRGGPRQDPGPAFEAEPCVRAAQSLGRQPSTIAGVLLGCLCRRCRQRAGGRCLRHRLGLAPDMAFRAALRNSAAVVASPPPRRLRDKLSSRPHLDTRLSTFTVQHYYQLSRVP